MIQESGGCTFTSGNAIRNYFNLYWIDCQGYMDKNEIIKTLTNFPQFICCNSELHLQYWVLACLINEKGLGTMFQAH